MPVKGVSKNPVEVPGEGVDRGFRGGFLDFVREEKLWLN